MNKASDIQEFKRLFALWLEADTTREQESRLCELAEMLCSETLDARLHKDMMLVLSLEKIAEEITEDDLELDKDGFASFVDRTVLPGVNRGCPRKWLWPGMVSAAAAAILLFFVVGKQSNEIAVGKLDNIPAVESKVAYTAKSDVKIEIATDTVKRVSPVKRREVQTNPHRESPAAGHDLKIDNEETSVNNDEQILEVREVTDPEEAAMLLSDSCNLLALCLTKAEKSTQEAIGTLNDNINIIFTEI